MVFKLLIFGPLVLQRPNEPLGNSVVVAATRSAYSGFLIELTWAKSKTTTRTFWIGFRRKRSSGLP